MPGTDGESVVKTPVDSAILVSLILIRWIVIYPVDNTIQLLNNRGNRLKYRPRSTLLYR